MEQKLVIKSLNKFFNYDWRCSWNPGIPETLKNSLFLWNLAASHLNGLENDDHENDSSVDNVDDDDDVDDFAADDDGDAYEGHLMMHEFLEDVIISSPFKGLQLLALLGSSSVPVLSLLGYYLCILKVVRKRNLNEQEY